MVPASKVYKQDPHRLKFFLEIYCVLKPSRTFIGIQNIDNLEIFTSKQYFSKTKAKQTLVDAENLKYLKTMDL